jgi:ketosteroid isomerase-like protein
VSTPPNNVDLLAEALRALNARDPEALQRLMHPDAEWRPALTAGGALEGTVYQGPQGPARYMEDLDDVFADTRVETTGVEEVAPDRVLWWGRVTARGRESGIPLDVEIWSLWEFRDGKVYRGDAFRSRAEAWAALERTS